MIFLKVYSEKDRKIIIQKHQTQKNFDTMFFSQCKLLPWQSNWQICILDDIFLAILETSQNFFKIKDKVIEEYWYES